MSFFTPTTKVVDLGDGNTVTLRKPTFGDTNAANSASMHAVDGGLQLDWPRYRVEVFKRCIVAWDGPNFDGQPPTSENVDKLPIEIGNKLVEATMELATAGDEAGN